MDKHTEYFIEGLMGISMVIIIAFFVVLFGWALIEHPIVLIGSISTILGVCAVAYAAGYMYNEFPDKLEQWK